MQDSQTEIVSFLGSPRAFPETPDTPVEVVETHGARIFLGGKTALKLKRAVVYDYMDLATPERRRAMLQRELDLNRPVAPEIYQALVPVTRTPGGALTLGGAGTPVDWVLRMRRFRAEEELTAVADRGALDDALATRLGTAIAGYHDAAPVRIQPGAPPIAAILDELGRVFAEFPAQSDGLRIADWLGPARAALDRVAPLLDRRGKAGHIRRGHGDLHLRNIVMIGDRPVPFDALEFDETLGTCDLLYDIGFLVMDLCHRGLARAACRVMDAWLLARGGAEDAGLAALPLFLSVRAAIRAMVLVQTGAARGDPASSSDEAAVYMDQARRFLAPAPARLVAVGGYSGSGKSVLARALAPDLGAMPGAVLLSSDLMRKAGRDPAAHLPERDYSAGARRQVYDDMLARAAVLLEAGQSVILDATFLDAELRRRARAVAEAAQVPFTGLFLTAPPEVLGARVAARRGDASDADGAVLQRQLARGTGPLDWACLDAAGTPEDSLRAARAAI